MATDYLFTELSGLCTLLFMIVVILLILTCICFKDGDKPQEYGTAGRLSINRDSPILHLQPRNGATLSISSRHSDISSEDGNLKRNSWTVKDRALPEIPDSVPPPEASNANEPVKVKNRIKAIAPKPPGSDSCKVFPVNGTALLSSENVSGITVTITVNDKVQLSGGNVKDSKGHAPVPECLPGTSSGGTAVRKKMVEKKEAATGGDHFGNLYDVVADRSDRVQMANESTSPLCIQVDTPGPSTESGGHSPSASLAVAGAVPSSDIPYMTPPLHVPPASFQVAHQNEGEEQQTGGRSEVPYTVISVREPLARVREITLRKQRTAVQQNSVESEDHYAMVPEEEQMYAEIGSGHDSASSSITYAHIEPRDLPPVPPTVESLKSVAHAHSRQASTVSTCSYTSNVSSVGEPSSPSPFTTPNVQASTSSQLYSTVDKSSSGKQRKTVHLAEGISVVAEKRKKVEDLYAKVRKKRTDLTISTSASEDYCPAYQDVNSACVTPPPSPWASTTPPAPPPLAGRLQASTLLPLGHVRRHSADPNLQEVTSDNRVFDGRSSLVLATSEEDPNYERIYNEESNSGDSCYERIRDEESVCHHCHVSCNNNNNDSHVSRHTCSKSGNDVVINPSVSYHSGYERMKEEEEADPGYECVEKCTDPGYEYVEKCAGSLDPGYEPVRSFDDSDSTNSDYTVVKPPGEIREPGYETVKEKNLLRSGSDVADPGYERIKKKKVPRNDSDATDPGYERVKNNNNNVADPGYETVQRSDSDNDPCYEIVRRNSGDGAGTPPTYGHSAGNCFASNSTTVLFVSGNHSQGNDEPSATFL